MIHSGSISNNIVVIQRPIRLNAFELNFDSVENPVFMNADQSFKIILNDFEMGVVIHRVLV